MAKILVADDNSNVQKTVALALTDLGVEVIAVNNGDAAIRKLADIAPDLVLADIFMPVRNGYEVCEYVKKDSRFSNVPVVLLVGAFDPLDEREAQRVGADGILKKPFVPPDPLMTMVKALLSRTLGDNLVGVAVSKPAVVAQEKSAPVAAVVERPAPPVTVEELPEEVEFPPSPDRVSFGEGERPVAFGQLLDTPSQGPEVVEPVDDATVLTSSRDASLGEPIFWKTEEPKEEADSDEEPSETEEEEEVAAEPSSRAWKLDQDAKPSQPEPEEFVQPVNPFELVRDDDSGQAATTVASSASILQDAASQAPLTVESGRAPDLAANPIEWMATAPPQHEEETEEAAPESNQEATDSAEETGEVESSHAEPAPAAPEPAPAAPWAPASSTAPVVPPSAAQPVQSQPKMAAEIPQPNKTQTSLNRKTLSQSAEDTARSIPKEDWADLAASLQNKSTVPAGEKSKPAPEISSHPAPANAAAPAAPDPALVEAVVQRILDKMRPQVVDIITKEFLRPIVQALVHREIEKG